MIVSLVFTAAISSMLSYASRLNVIPRSGVIPHSMIGPMTHQGPMVRTLFTSPHPQMRLAGSSRYEDTPDDYDTRARELLSSVLGEEAESGANHWQPPSQQMLPPRVIYDAASRTVLHDWAASFVDPFSHEPDPFEDRWKATVLFNMRDAVAKWTDVFRQRTTKTKEHSDLEMVALIPQNFEPPFVEKGSSGAPLLALGIFSRQKIRDHRMGSLHEKLEKQHGWQWTQLFWGNVFAIDGIAAAPHLNEREARILLSKIEKYAHQERKIVVVPKHALKSGDETDLTSYYVHLGFEWVEMGRPPRLGEDGMESRHEWESRHELVYMGGSSSIDDQWVENQQTMIGMNLWTNIDGGAESGISP